MRSRSFTAMCLAAATIAAGCSSSSSSESASPPSSTDLVPVVASSTLPVAGVDVPVASVDVVQNSVLVTAGDGGAGLTTSTDQTASTVAVSAGNPRCGAPAGAQTVTIWQIFGGTSAKLSFQSLIDQFNATHPGITLVERQMQGFPDMESTLQSLPDDQWPDIVVTAPSALKELVETGLVVAPDECAQTSERDDLLPVVRATYTVSGRQQATPYGVSTPVMLYDAAEARRAGLDTNNPPTTLAEMRAWSQQVVAKGVSPYGFVAFDDDGEFLIDEGSAQRGQLVAQPDNGRFGDQLKVDLGTPENIAAMQWLKDIVATGGGVWIGGDPSATEDLVKIIDNKNGGTFTFHTSASIGDILAAMKAGSFGAVELGVGPMPGPAAGGTVGGNGMFLIDHGSPSRAGAAATAIGWLTAAPQMAAFDVATGYIPPSQAVAAQPAVIAAYTDSPQLKVGYDQLAKSNGDPAAAGTAFGPGPSIDTLFQDMTTKIVGDGLDPAATMGETSQLIDGQLDAYAAQAPPP